MYMLCPPCNKEVILAPSTCTIFMCDYIHMCDVITCTCYIYLQVIRVFGEMDYYNQSVMKMLHRKSAGQDAIAK